MKPILILLLLLPFVTKSQTVTCNAINAPYYDSLTAQVNRYFVEKQLQNRSHPGISTQMGQIDTLSTHISSIPCVDSTIIGGIMESLPEQVDIHIYSQELYPNTVLVIRLVFTTPIQVVRLWERENEGW